MAKTKHNVGITKQAVIFRLAQNKRLFSFNWCRKLISDPIKGTVHMNLTKMGCNFINVPISKFHNHLSKNNLICIILFVRVNWKNIILLSEFFWPTVRKNCSTFWENFWNSRLNAENFQKFSQKLEQFIHTVKDQNNVW